jgi:hypothetical protein
MFDDHHIKFDTIYFKINKKGKGCQCDSLL